MSVVCLICQSVQSNETIALFKFPSDEILRVKWLNALGLGTVPPEAQICEKHFQQSDFQEVKSNSALMRVRKQLRSGTIPTLQLNNANNAIDIDNDAVTAIQPPRKRLRIEAENSWENFEEFLSIQTAATQTEQENVRYCAIVGVNVETQIYHYHCFHCLEKYTIWNWSEFISHVEEEHHIFANDYKRSDICNEIIDSVQTVVNETNEETCAIQSEVNETICEDKDNISKHPLIVEAYSLINTVCGTPNMTKENIPNTASKLNFSSAVNDADIDTYVISFERTDSVIVLDLLEGLKALPILWSIKYKRCIAYNSALNTLTEKINKKWNMNIATFVMEIGILRIQEWFSICLKNDEKAKIERLKYPEYFNKCAEFLQTYETSPILPLPTPLSVTKENEVRQVKVDCVPFSQKTTTILNNRLDSTTVPSSDIQNVSNFQEIKSYMKNECEEYEFKIGKSQLCEKNILLNRECCITQVTNKLDTKTTQPSTSKLVTHLIDFELTEPKIILDFLNTLPEYPALKQYTRRDKPNYNIAIAELTNRINAKWNLNITEYVMSVAWQRMKKWCMKEWCDAESKNTVNHNDKVSERHKYPLYYKKLVYFLRNIKTDCEDRCSLKQENNSEIATDTTEQIHVCCYCDKAYKEKHRLVEHLKMHLIHINHNCDMCDKKYLNETQLKVHKLNVHKSSFSHEYTTSLLPPYHRFTCSICRCAFNRKFDLLQHFNIVHGSKPQTSEFVDVADFAPNGIDDTDNGGQL